MIHFITTTIYLCTLFWCLSLQCCAARDNITMDTSIRDEIQETLASPGETFELGFFSPNGNKGRYVGIWYKEDPQTVVWVANRDKPLHRLTGVVLVAEDGNFKVLDKEKGDSFFSTNLEYSQSSSRILKLLDTGNLVLMDDETGSNIVWQSFQHPTDTFLPGMKMDDSINLTSWKNQDDPGSGDFTFREDDNQYIIFKDITTPHWKSGKLSSGSSFNPSRMFGAATIMLSNNSRQVAKSVGNRVISDRTLLPPAGHNYNDSRLVMNSQGVIEYWNWLSVENGKGWNVIWWEPKNKCSVYNTCGAYAMCRSVNGCNCLPGFEPNNPDNWKAGDYTTGCKRMYQMCVNLTYTFSESIMMEVGESNPQFFPELGSEECKNKCSEKCQCQAYSYTPNDTELIIAGRSGGKEGCWIWLLDSELVDIRKGYADSGHNLTLKTTTERAGVGNPQKSEGSPGKKPKHSLEPFVIFAITILAILLVCSMSYIGYWRMMNVRRESREISYRGSIGFQLPDSVRRINDLLDGNQFREDDTKTFDVPSVDLECILAATNDFSHANKLGQGGFGPVYKGKLPGGQEIAVKRLSSDSGQGLEEFKNEVLLIAKLQHRNLVRLLGYCAKADEKMLLYEYMPNKSLDNFIFDRSLCLLLDWPKRFEIILGIARGLLYLHQDSRLRIIHRDLKTSNILLDEDMNPKISDFGLARIVGGRETEASTKKVIGTYGYMSPEYALDGFFSIKSDVFSFGVVMLEIISGKRNTGFYESQQALNLLGYAWSLWNEEKALDLMDQTLNQSCNASEVMKCINVGLLCVQEDPVDRPTMSNVVFMLGSDIASLQQPKQPAFVARRRISSSPSSSSGKHDSQTNNEMTISVLKGR